MMKEFKLNPQLFKSEPVRRCTLDECHAACCLHGVWVDIIDMDDILAHHELIAPFMPDDYQDRETWFDGRRDEDPYALSGVVGHTRVIPDTEHYGGTACVFLRSDYKCALQVAAEKVGFHPWRFKPFYCILHPLDLDEEGRITIDDIELMLDEPASCIRRGKRKTPLTTVFEAELTYLLGKDYYEKLTKNKSSDKTNP